MHAVAAWLFMWQSTNQRSWQKRRRRRNSALCVTSRLFLLVCCHGASAVFHIYRRAPLVKSMEQTAAIYINMHAHAFEYNLRKLDANVCMRVNAADYKAWLIAICHSRLLLRRQSCRYAAARSVVSNNILCSLTHAEISHTAPWMFNAACAIVRFGHRRAAGRR